MKKKPKDHSDHMREKIIADAAARGWDYAALAKAAKVSPPQVFRYLRSERGLAANALLKVMDALDILAVTEYRKEKA